MTGPDHDAAATAARYLADDLPNEERRSIEAHMMSCDSCWAEMTTARAGRTLAESLREPAPQSAREMLRSIAASTPDDSTDGRYHASRVAPSARRRGPVRWLRAGSGGRQRVAAAVLIVAVAAALTGIVSLLSGRPADGDPLRAAAAEYQVPSSQPVGKGEQPPAARIGELDWTETDHKTIGDQPATLYRYVDPVGHRLVLISSAESFPRADNAEDLGSGPEWIADIGGVSVLCADAEGLSWLVVAGSRDEAIAAGAAVGLTA